VVGRDTSVHSWSGPSTTVPSANVHNVAVEGTFDDCQDLVKAMFADVAFRLAPLDRIDALELIGDLGTQALLGEFRGEPAVDRDALAGTLLALSAVADDPAVRAVDLNPLIVVDGRPVAVDALVETGDAA
jgi:hypothetical protein